MAKEVSSFIVDVSPSMALPYHATTELGFGLAYAKDFIAEKIIKQRKTIYTELLVSFFEPNTNQSFRAVSSELVGTCVVEEIGVPTIGTVRLLNGLRASVEKQDTKNRLLVGLLKAIQDIVGFVGKRKFLKTIYLVTNAGDYDDYQDFLESTVVLDQVVELMNHHAIGLVVAGVGFEKYTRIEFVDLWKSFVGRVGGTILNHDGIVQQLTAASVKPVKPVKVFEGQFRLGCSAAEILGLQELNYDSLKLDIEGYPCVKAAHSTSTPSAFTRNILDAKKIDWDHYKVKRVTDYVIYNDNAAVSVGDADLAKTYRYGNEKIPLSDTLDRQRVYRTSPGLDFRGIVKLHKIPPWYLLLEPVYLVGKNDTRNSMGFGSIVEALRRMDSAIVARYVRKPEAEVQMVLLMPKVVGRGTKAKYSLVLSRLPFLEDEKVTHFTPLDSLPSGAEKLLPNAEMKHAMNQYISDMDVNGSDFIQPSPGIHKLAGVLKHMINGSGEFLELERQYFDNLTANGKIPAEVQLRSRDLAAQLKRVLGVEYVAPKEPAEEEEVEFVGELEDFTDLDQLLGI